MSYSVRNVRNLYYADGTKAKGSLWSTTPKKNVKGATNAEGSWDAYQDLEGCRYFECVENEHIVRTPKIERVTYVKVTPGSEMNQKIYSYDVTLDAAKIKGGVTYSLTIRIPDFNGIDEGLSQTVMGTATAQADGDVVGLANAIFADIKNKKQQRSGDINHDSAMLWDLYLDINKSSVDAQGKMTFLTQIPEPEKDWQAGADYMPEIQERRLVFEFMTVSYEDANGNTVYESKWGSASEPTAIDVAGSYKQKLNAMWWFYNTDRGSIKTSPEWMDPTPKGYMHDFTTMAGDYSVIDLHYRVDGDGSIMGDVDVTIIVKESDKDGEAKSTTNAEKILAELELKTTNNNTKPDQEGGKTMNTFGI